MGKRPPLAPARSPLRLFAHHDLLVKTKSVNKSGVQSQVGAADAYETLIASDVGQNEPFCLMSADHPQQRRGFAPRFFAEHWTKR